LKYDPQVAFTQRANILNSVCNQYSDPINPEFLGLYGTYYDSDKLEFEEKRNFYLGHNITSCVPDFSGSQILSEFLSRFESSYDETDSMDPCSAFHFLKAAEPDLSDKPIPHPDYPGKPSGNISKKCNLK
jgi:hypothetical protein